MFYCILQMTFFIWRQHTFNVLHEVFSEVLRGAHSVFYYYYKITTSYAHSFLATSFVIWAFLLFYSRCGNCILKNYQLQQSFIVVSMFNDQSYTCCIQVQLLKSKLLDVESVQLPLYMK